MENEQVLVVPAALLRDLGGLDGVSTDMQRFSRLLRSDSWCFRPRAEVETDPNWKQLIPYVVLYRRVEGQEPELLVYQRGKGQGEARLHAKWSIGVGGHVRYDDGCGTLHGLSTLIIFGAERELLEELHIAGTIVWPDLWGVVNHDRDSVGEVHTGLIYPMDLRTATVRAAEEDMEHVQFVPLSQVDVGRELEPWSVLCLDALRTFPNSPFAGQQAS